MPPRKHKEPVRTCHPDPVDPDERKGKGPHRQPNPDTQINVDEGPSTSAVVETEVGEEEEEVNQLAVQFSRLRTQSIGGQIQVAVTPPYQPPVVSPFHLALMAAAITPDQLLNMIHALMMQVGNLTTQVTTVSIDMQAIAQQLVEANQNRPAAYVQKPAEWEGTQGSTEARHFLAAFVNWASSTRGSMNQWIPAVAAQIGPPAVAAAPAGWQADECKWIKAAMNLMKGPAHSWALPYLETICAGGDPFPTCTDFEIAFNRRFTPLDSTQAARDMLKAIKQGKRSVVEYTVCPTSINTSNRRVGPLMTTVNTFTMVLTTTSKTYLLKRNSYDTSYL